MEKILKGKPIGSRIRKKIKEIIAEHGLEPSMLLLQPGGDAASAYYVQNTISTGAKLGCKVELKNLPADLDAQELRAVIEEANNDPQIHGIMLQKPLPAHIPDAEAGTWIDPCKDIDSLNPMNLGKIILSLDSLLPCTPTAVLCTLRHYNIPLQGKHVLIIGRSSIVGKPLANMLLWKKTWADATVTVCHSRTQNLSEMIQTADIVVAAIGRPEFVKADMIKKNAVLIDVGINEITKPDGSVGYVGDIDYNSCFDKALAITPVPGGIGTVTTSLLFLNLLKASLAAKGTNKNIDDFLDLIFEE